MSEWSIEHVWKSTLSARADAHEIPPTQFRINHFRNIDARQRVPVTDALHQGLTGYLTQSSRQVATTIRNKPDAVRARIANFAV
jgi:hypothetical protein